MNAWIIAIPIIATACLLSYYGAAITSELRKMNKR